MNYDFLANNPQLQNISKEKLDFLAAFANQNFSTKPDNIASQLSGAAESAKSQGINFTSQETSILIEILKQQMNPEEQQKADKIIRLIRTFSPH